MARRFTKYPNNYVKAAFNTDKVLKIKNDNGRIESYPFKYESEEGDVFEPETGSGNWWTSYIVTPDKKLLMWDFNGRYYPCSDVYGDTFWVE